MATIEEYVQFQFIFNYFQICFLNIYHCNRGEQHGQILPTTKGNLYYYGTKLRAGETNVLDTDTAKDLISESIDITIANVIVLLYNEYHI